MRPLTEDETRALFEKLSKYPGELQTPEICRKVSHNSQKWSQEKRGNNSNRSKRIKGHWKTILLKSGASFSKPSIGENIKLLIDRPDGMYCFRYHRDRVFYVSEDIMKRAASVVRDHLVSFGTCFGKFSKTRKFRLHITALDYLAPYAKCKVWVKPGAEQSFLYGNHVLKSGLGRITENTEKYQGVVIYSMSDVPLGFGAAAKSTQECRHTDPMSIVVFHQADIGEYLRNEDTLL